MKKIILLSVFLLTFMTILLPVNAKENNGKVSYYEYADNLNNLNITFSSLNDLKKFDYSDWLKQTRIDNRTKNFDYQYNYDITCLNPNELKGIGTSDKDKETTTIYFMIDITNDCVDKMVLDEIHFYHIYGIENDVTFTIDQTTSSEDMQSLGFGFSEKYKWGQASQNFDWTWGYGISSSTSISRSKQVAANKKTGTYHAQLIGEYHHFLLIEATLTYNRKAIYTGGCDEKFDHYEYSYNLAYNHDDISEYWDYTRVTVDYPKYVE